MNPRWDYIVFTYLLNFPPAHSRDLHRYHCLRLGVQRGVSWGTLRIIVRQNPS